MNEFPNAFYFSFDEPRHQNYETLKHVIEVFLEEAEKPLIALDEVGAIKEWGGVIKRYYDQGKARFILSGSSSLSITKGKESLAGRLYEVFLPPFQYNEFVSLHYGRPAISFDQLFKMRLKSYVEEFFAGGSFPEVVGWERELRKKYILDLADKVVFEDIPHIFRVEYRNKLYALLKYVAEYSSGIFFENNVGELLGLNKGTVAEYLFYLSKSYLASLIYKRGSLTQKLRKIKKAFISCPSLYYALCENYHLPRAAEVAVFDKLSSFGTYPEFYRDNQKREVDFVYKGIPIEVKFRNQITRHQLSPLYYYIKKFSPPRAFVITKDLLDSEDVGGCELFYLPLHYFLSLASFPA